MRATKTMKTPHSTLYRYSAEAVVQANKIPSGTVAEKGHKDGMTEGEPLIIAMDCMIKYAEAYKVRFSGCQTLAEDYVLGDEWLSVVKGIRGLLNSDGANALFKGTLDTKDNGAVEGMFWDALAMAGYTEETANL